MSIPAAGSPGEECLALHLRAHRIRFEREVSLIPGRKWRWDFLIAGRVAVEVQGGTWTRGRHSRGAGQAGDCAKANAATLAGIPVLYYTTEMVTSGAAIDDIRALLAREPGQTLVESTPSAL